jgi:hypothetical protein
MNINSRREGAELASRLLRYPVEEAFEYSREIPEIDAFFYWRPARGGGKILIGRDGSVLFAISAITIDDMIPTFRSGRRTDISLFEVD